MENVRLKGTIVPTIGQWADYIDVGPIPLPEGTTYEEAMSILEFLIHMDVKQRSKIPENGLSNPAHPASKETSTHDS